MKIQPNEVSLRSATHNVFIYSAHIYWLCQYYFAMSNLQQLS